MKKKTKKLKRYIVVKLGEWERAKAGETVGVKRK